MNTIQVKKYDLPDSYLFENQVDNISVKFGFPNIIASFWGEVIILSDSLLVENIMSDNIPVYKRPSGGETVILTPNTIVIQLLLKQPISKEENHISKKYNNNIINALKR